MDLQNLQKLNLLSMEQQHKAKITKQIVTGGQDKPKPSKFSKVLIKTWPPEMNLDQSFQYEVVLGNNELQSSLQEIVMGMRVGDIAEVNTWNQYTDKQQTMFIALCQILSQEQQKNLSTDKFIEASDTKEAANNLFKQKKYEEAQIKYKHALELIQFDQRPDSIKLKLTIMSNLAQLNLNLQKYEQCKKYSMGYMKQSHEKNYKINYRLICAEKGLKNWDVARELCRQAREQWKDSAQNLEEFVKLEKDINLCENKEKEQTKKTYAKMFS